MKFFANAFNNLTTQKKLMLAALLMTFVQYQIFGFAHLFYSQKLDQYLYSYGFTAFLILILGIPLLLKVHEMIMVVVVSTALIVNTYLVSLNGGFRDAKTQ